MKMRPSIVVLAFSSLILTLSAPTSNALSPLNKKGGWSLFSMGSAGDPSKKDPSSSCGHVFVLNCACPADGIAADGILVSNGKVSKKPVCKAKSQGKSTVRLYNAGMPHDVANILPLFESFLEQSGAHFQGKWSSFKRGKPLIAFDPTSFFLRSNSFSGSGGGSGSNIDHDDDNGTEDEKIAVFKELMTKLYSIVDEFGVDVAVCIPDEEMYLSTQKLRDEMCPFKGGPFWMLSQELRAGATKLAKHAKIGRLSIFIGAGISIPSGAPSWNDLLEKLATKANCYSEQDKECLRGLDFLDRPTIIAEDMGEYFKPAVADILKQSMRFTPAHVLLSSLKLPAVTTNYDELYEKAAASGTNLNVPLIPWDSRSMIEAEHSEKNSLLKLHGCVNHPSSIVLSRSDYMRYASRSQALRGRLHGMFLTTEMLFCGFSMTDDNVHHVIDEVRKVLYKDGAPTEHKLGTILTMTENKMFNRLWDQDFAIHSFGKSWDDNPAWRHDCFLDCVVALAVTDENDEL